MATSRRPVAPPPAVKPRGIEERIHLVRGQRVMMDSDLATLYGVRTKALNQAVSRNVARFPADFAFLLTPVEQASLRSQIVTSKGRGGTRYASRAFTEQGVAMLSSVLRSRRAIEVNVAIMRAFVHLREMLSSHADLARRIDELEQRYDGHFAEVFAAIRVLTASSEPDGSRPRIGFTVDPGATPRTSAPAPSSPPPGNTARADRRRAAWPQARCSADR